MTSHDYEGVVATTPVSFDYARQTRRNVHGYLAGCLARLCQQAGIPKHSVDGLAIASYGLAPDHAAALSAYCGISPRWLLDLPYGGASGVIALQRSGRAVQCGDAEIVACVAADVMTGGAFGDLIAGFSHTARDYVYPYGAAGPNAMFAMMTADGLARGRFTREDLGLICLAQRHNAAANPTALLRRPLSLPEYLNARPIAEPLGLYDCVMPCAGAEGFLVMTRRRAEALEVPAARLLGTIERHNAFNDDPVQRRGGWAMDRDRLYQMAGVGPAAIDLAQLYDDYPVVVMMQLEELGLCPAGHAGEFVRTTALTFDGGGLPINTGGGQLSIGQAGAAGGYLGVVEGIRQITGHAGVRQVPRARHCLVSGYGTVTFDRGLCSAAAILGAGTRPQ